MARCKGIESTIPPFYQCLRIQNLYSVGISEEYPFQFMVDDYLKYRSFKARSANSFIFYPYLLKEYRNRWFVYGVRKNGRILQNLALDRIQSAEATWSSRRLIISLISLKWEKPLNCLTGTLHKKYILRSEHILWRPCRSNQELRKQSGKSRFQSKDVRKLTEFYQEGYECARVLFEE